MTISTRAVSSCKTSRAPAKTSARNSPPFLPASATQFSPLTVRGHRSLPTQPMSGCLAMGTDHLRRATRGESFNMEFTAIDGNGARRRFEANGRPVEDAEGRYQWGVLVIREVSERPHQ